MDRALLSSRRLVVGAILSVITSGAGATIGVAADILRSHLEPAGMAAASPPPPAGSGLDLSRASTVLRQQLGLERGAGLVVDGVHEGSWAAEAGFRQHDVLVRLDEQLLVLPEQFDALMESASPQSCTVLRAGREVSITLGAVARVASPSKASPGPFGLRPTPSSVAIMQEAVRPAGGQPSGRTPDETLVRQDPDYLIRLTSGEETRLVVFEPGGRIVFNDAIDSREGQERIPPAVRDRVADMEKMLERRSTPPVIRQADASEAILR